jgi:hypothetical protein
MGSPVCKSNKSVSSDQVQSAQSEAESKLAASKPVLDKEIISKSKQKQRAAEICKKTGFCGEDWWGNHDGIWARKFVLSDYARKMTDFLSPPIGQDDRTYQNVLRLFSSKRVSTQAIADMLQLYLNNDKTGFRKSAQAFFLSAQLFYYDYVPLKGAILCFVEGK